MTIDETKEKIAKVEGEIRHRLRYLASFGVRVQRIDVRYVNFTAERFRLPVVADVRIEAEIIRRRRKRTWPGASCT